MTDRLSIHSTEAALTAPERAAPGYLTFLSSTASAAHGWVGLARFKGSPDWAEFCRNVRDTVSDEPSRIVAGTEALHEQVAMLGGAVTHPDRPGEFTVNLTPGEYVFFDYPDTVAADQPRRRFMTVQGNQSPGRQVEPAVRIRAVQDTLGNPRFEITGAVTAGGPILFENAMAEPQLAEFVLLPISSQTGEAELADYFSRFQDGSGEWPASPPFDVTRGSGCLPMSPGRQAIMRIATDPGRYVVINWLKSGITGVRMAKLGQYAIIENTKCVEESL